MKAADVMVRDVVTVAPDATVRDLAKTLVDHRISAVPVVDAEGRLVGIVSEGDLLRRTELGMERQRSWLDVFSLPETLTQEFVKSHALKVADVMTRDVVTAEEEASLAEIANLLERHHVKRLPIVRGGRVVGIVSRANILQAFASLPEAKLPAAAPSDRELREAVLKAIAAAGIGDPGHLNVIVHDGTVELWGVVAERQRQPIRVAAESTPGVAAVQDHMIGRQVIAA